MAKSTAQKSEEAKAAAAAKALAAKNAAAATAAGHAPAGKGFTPTPAPVAPAGTYDPSLDATARAADRGLNYSTQDAERDKERLSTSYTVGKEHADAQQKYSLADLLSGRTRSLADLLTGKSREGEDYSRLSADLGRNYAELGAGQTAKASSGAFVDTGSIAAAGAARAVNQGRDQGLLDQSHTRFGEDNARDVGRVNEDYATGVDRTNAGHDETVGDLGREFQYGTDDLATALQRGGFENNFFHQDTDAAKMYQATTSGLYTPPEKPGNEFSDEKGPYRLVVAHGLRFKERPNGVREAAGVAS